MCALLIRSLARDFQAVRTSSSTASPALYWPRMNVIVDFCLIPLGTGVSLSPYVAACEKILREAGLHAVLHANGTNIEGDWEAVFAAIKRCHETVHAMGAPRISTIIKLGTRVDRPQSMENKIESVRQKLRG